MHLLLSTMARNRQLAAIMFSDIVGYTALMGKDEDKAFSILNTNRSIHQEFIEKNHGRFIKELGDGVLAQFNSAYDATRCAIEIQQEARLRLDARLRIGIHLGDITVENNDVFGDGVNVASRIQGITEPGGIFISDSIENAIRNRADIQTVYLGRARLKNVDYACSIYAVQGDGLPASSYKPSKIRTKKSGRIHSIAVLPFVNLTGSTEQDFIVEGIHDALITEISHIRSLRVISRTSSMKYAGCQLPITQIGKELNVDALVESSMLRANGRVRLNVQLIRVVPMEDHIWACFFDQDLKNIFKMISNVTQEIARQIEIVLSPKEKKLITTKTTIEPEIYKLYLRGKIYLSRYTPEGFQKGIQALNEVLAKDPTFAPAYATLSIGYGDLAHLPAAPQEAFPRAKALAKKALELNPELTEANTAMAECCLYNDFDIPAAKKYFEMALAIDPNYAPAVSNYGWLLDLIDEKADAEKFIRKSADLDPLAPIYRAWLAWWYWLEERYEEGIIESKRVLDISPDFPIAEFVLGGIYASCGKHEESLIHTKKAMGLFPGLEYAYGIALIKAGKRQEAETFVEKMDKTPFNAFSLLLIHSELGNKEEVWKWTRVIYDIRHIFTPWIISGAIDKRLKDDPEVIKILQPVLDSIHEARKLKNKIEP
jgi:class 3 adenylate cyclase/tetratricopeptide (TPR) repeat protein